MRFLCCKCLLDICGLVSIGIPVSFGIISFFGLLIFRGYHPFEKQIRTEIIL